MTIRGVIFDLGHTIWDIRPQPDALARAYVECREELATALGRSDLPEAESMRTAVARVLRQAGETYFSSSDDLVQPPSHTYLDLGCRSLGLELDDALLRRLSPPLFATEIDGLVCGEGTVDALTALSHRYPLGCVTNTLADGDAIRAMLRLHNIEHFMRSVVVSSEEGVRKPHVSLFQKAARQLGVAPSEAVFVGDSPTHDITGAKAAGMHAVLTRQYVCRAYGDPESPDAEIGHLRELPDVIGVLNERSSTSA